MPNADQILALIPMSINIAQQNWSGIDRLWEELVGIWSALGIDRGSPDYQHDADIMLNIIYCGGHSMMSKISRVATMILKI